jgi:hypothetical protein
MVAMKRTLLEIVQNILNDLDSDEVNSIDDTIEATQVANIVANTYFDLISDRVIPEHKELFKLTALADSTRPNYLVLPDNIGVIEEFWYDVNTDGTKLEYREITWLDPLDFIRKVAGQDSSASNTITVPDFNGSTDLVVFNDKMPTFYTSFDNEHIVTDSYDVAVDTTLANSKTRGYGTVIPTVTLEDSFQFDFESKYFPYLVAEAKSRSFSIIHKTVDQKVEQTARRHKNFIQKEKYRFEDQRVSRRAYGRN